MSRQTTESAVWLCCGMLLTGCAVDTAIKSPDPHSTSKQTSVLREGPHVLAGEWEYEEGGVVVVVELDHEGNGCYDFMDGEFKTATVADHTWTGTWLQRENNREGGFEVKLSSDYARGEGRWWYTRIEDNRSPEKPGGIFHINRPQHHVRKDTESWSQ